MSPLPGNVKLLTLQIGQDSRMWSSSIKVSPRAKDYVGSRKTKIVGKTDTIAQVSRECKLRLTSCIKVLIIQVSEINFIQCRGQLPILSCTRISIAQEQVVQPILSAKSCRPKWLLYGQALDLSPFVFWIPFETKMRVQQYLHCSSSSCALGRLAQRSCKRQLLSESVTKALHHAWSLAITRLTLMMHLPDRMKNGFEVILLP